VKLLHLHQLLGVGGGREEVGGAPLNGAAQEKDRLLLHPEVDVEALAGGGDDLAQAQQAVKLFGHAALTQPMHLVAVDDVADLIVLAAPGEHVAVVGLDGDLAEALAVADHVVAALVETQRAQGLNDGRLAAVVGPHQHCQPLGQIDDRVGVGHVVDERDPPQHAGNTHRTKGRGMQE
jgi:hypothetical protein